MTTTTIIYPADMEERMKKQYEADFNIIDEGEVGLNEMRYMKLKLKKEGVD